LIFRKWSATLLDLLLTSFEGTRAHSPFFFLIIADQKMKKDNFQSFFSSKLISVMLNGEFQNDNHASGLSILRFVSEHIA